MPLSFSRATEDFLLGPVPNDHAGALVRFHGVVRALNHKKSVSHLFYEAYESLAAEEFARIEGRAKKRFAIERIFALHRLGNVAPGEIAVILDVYAPHRSAAFHAARFMMDELKKSVPIWKCEYYSDGTKSWDQSLCACTVSSKTVFMPVDKAFLSQSYDSALVRAKKILLVGAGGLGCPMAVQIGALGIKNLVIIDHDKVELTNLARQFCYTPADVGIAKSYVLAEFLRERFSLITIEEIEAKFDKHQVNQIEQADVIIDTTDSLLTKAYLASLAYRAQKDFMSLSVHQEEGEVSIIPGGSQNGCFSCFRAIKNEQGCSTNGVFTLACFMIAAHATGLLLDLLSNKIGSSSIHVIKKNAVIPITLSKDRACACCGPFPLKRTNIHDRIQRCLDADKTACASV